MAKPQLDHPSLPLVKEAFPDARLLATSYRGQTTLVIGRDTLSVLHDVLAFLRNDERCAYDFLSDVTGVDYLDYPAQSKLPTGAQGRFGVVYNLVSTTTGTRLLVKAMLDPSIGTEGIENDPSLHLPSVCDLWPGAEWSEREVYDMFGIHFDGHPDHRRILTWERYPAHPLRKDYPLRGRGERESYKVIDRDSA